MLPILLRYGYFAALAALTLIFSIILTFFHFFSTYFLLAENSIKAGLTNTALTYFDSTARSLGYLPSEIFTPQLPPKTIDEIIDREAKRYRVSPTLIHAIKYCESSGRFDALSNKGALGPMQIMSFNAKRCRIPEFKLHDPEANIACGAQIISENLSNNNDNTIHALEEYLGGPKCIGGRCKEGAPYINCVIDAMSGRPHHRKAKS